MQSEYQRNKVKYLERAKRHYELTISSPEKRLRRMVIEARSRAKSRNLPFDITPEDITWNDSCPILGIPILLLRSGRGGIHNSPSLDRIRNEEGYVKGNVRLISNRANKLKNDMTKEECRLLLENWEKHVS